MLLCCTVPRCVQATLLATVGHIKTTLQPGLAAELAELLSEGGGEGDDNKLARMSHVVTAIQNWQVSGTPYRAVSCYRARCSRGGAPRILASKHGWRRDQADGSWQLCYMRRLFFANAMLLCCPACVCFPFPHRTCMHACMRMPEVHRACHA